MANIDITDAGASLSNGLLQLENGVAMDTTLRYVADQLNTKSQLLLATNATTVEGTLKVKTDNIDYLDVEDGSGNNRFTISRPALGQKVALDFASNPVGSTTIVGAIRTYQDGINLSDTMVFREDGHVGIGAASPSGLLHVDGGANVARMILDADTNLARIFSFRTNDTPRWAFRIDGNETGTNAGSDFSIRRYNDAGTFIDAPLAINRANGRVSINERLLIESDSTVTTQTSSVIASSTTNANMVIAPNGTGALVASIPDGTATGGNSRGNYALDLQRTRTAASQVASGLYSAIINGNKNSAIRSYGTVLNGDTNQSNGEYSVVLNGTSNISGGFGSNYTTVINGDRCNATSEMSISAGNQSTASNLYAIALGDRSTASGTSSFAFSGVSSGNNSIAFSGTASSDTSFAYNARAYLRSMVAFGNSDNISVFGSNAQASFVIARRTISLTTGATALLSLDGTGVTNLIIPFGTGLSGRVWNVTIKYVSVVTIITGTATGVNVGDMKSQNIEIGFRSGTGLVGSGVYSIAQEDASMNSATLIPSYGGSNDLALTFTAPTFAGGGSVTCKVVAKVELVEAAW